MSRKDKTKFLDLSRRKVPDDLTELYRALQVANGDAVRSAFGGETRWEREWRVATRLCRQFLAATEESAQLALTSKLGDWKEARRSKVPPENEYTFYLWLAAQAWRLLDFASKGAEERDDDYIETVRHVAREGIIAAKTSSTLGRTMAFKALRAENRIEDRERGPELTAPGKTPPVRKGNKPRGR